MQERAFGFADSAFDTADHVVAVAEWSESIITVRDNIHYRYWLRLLLL